MTAEHTKARAAHNAKRGAAKIKRAKRAAKKPRRKTESSANELLLAAWQYTYAHRYERVD